MRLVQYYFGTKGELMLATQRRVAERSVERLRSHVQAVAERTPRAELRAVLGSFIPVDDESREHMLVFIALARGGARRPVARPGGDAPRCRTAWPRGAADARAGPAAGRRRRRRLEATLLVAAVPSLAQGVLDGSFSAGAGVRRPRLRPRPDVQGVTSGRAIWNTLPCGSCDHRPAVAVGLVGRLLDRRRHRRRPPGRRSARRRRRTRRASPGTGSRPSETITSESPMTTSAGRPGTTSPVAPNTSRRKRDGRPRRRPRSSAA